MKKKDVLIKQEDNIGNAVEAIKTALLQGQLEASGNVNRVQLIVYFAIGRYISLHTRHGGWGKGVLESISERLHRELPGLRGFSANSLKNMRKFYENWRILDSDEAVASGANGSTIAIVGNRQRKSTIAIVDLVPAETIDIHHAMKIRGVDEFPAEDFFRVPFTHHVRIIESVKDIAKRYAYIRKTAEEHLSVDALQRCMAAGNDVPGMIPSNFTRSISSADKARKAISMFKDSYLLDFINVEELGARDIEDVDERLVEQKIVQNIKNFVMTFGKDFAFVGNQYHLEVYGVEHFPDLLFFNRELNALVVVELKTGAFKSAYLGQLMTYLRILDDHVKKPHESPSIGIVLCKSAKREYVEYVIQDYRRPMGVATYSTSDEMPERLRRALPSSQSLKKLLS